MNNYKKIYNIILLTSLSIICLVSNSKEVESASLWENIFKQDIDEDGIDEYTYRRFTGTVSKDYHFLYTNADASSYPGYYDITLDSVGFDWDSYNAAVAAYDKASEDLDIAYSACDGAYDIEAVEAAYYAAEDAYYAAEDVKYDYEKLLETARDNFAKSKGIYVNERVNHAKDTNVTTTETLTYMFHKPFNYDPNKSYPVLVFCPGSGGTYGSDFNTTTGVYKKASLVPGDAGWCSTTFSGWYNAVKSSQENEDKYDCFIIYIWPDGGWTNYYYSSKHRQTALSITNQSSYPLLNCPTFNAAYTGNTTYKASYGGTYRASLTCPNRDSQLVTQLIDSLMYKYNIDYSRQYIAGASLGGAFTMDTINHYPSRFACAFPLVTPASDVSYENAVNLLNMNIWAIGASNDGNCNKYHSKYFAKAVNDARELSTTPTYGTTQYSIFSGGHACSYLSTNTKNAVEGVSHTSSYQMLDFMFNSKRLDIDNNAIKSKMKEAKHINNKLYSSENLNNDKFDIALVSSLPIVDEVEHGFIVKVVNNNKTKITKIPVESKGTSLSFTLENRDYNLNGYDFKGLDIYSTTINNIPNTVTSLSYQSYVKTKDSTIYSDMKAYNVEYNSNQVRMVEVNEN